MPLQVIESTDPIASLIRFQTSTLYELLISLGILLKPGRHAAWAAETRSLLPPGFWEELNAIYAPYGGGSLFIELAVDYPDHADLPGFARYVRAMAPVDFVFYLTGRIVPREAIAATGLRPERLTAALEDSGFPAYCACSDVSFVRILDDPAAFQARLTDLWMWYWDAYFAERVPVLRTRWETALADKTALLERQGGMGLYEHVTGQTDLPRLLPADHPITDVVFVPICFASKPVYIIYGYGNVTLLYDSELTTSRRAEIEQHKENALSQLKALGDNSRLDILRLIAHHQGSINGKNIAAKLNLSASAVSRHLSQLRDAGLIVEETQDNRTITYRLQRDAILVLPELVLDYLEN